MHDLVGILKRSHVSVDVFNNHTKLQADWISELTKIYYYIVSVLTV